MKQSKTIGIILAGGTGERIGATVPKHLLKVAGKTILERTVSVFNETASIDEIIVVVTKGWEEQVEQILVSKFPKVSTVLQGGESRNESTKNVLNYFANRDDVPSDTKLIIHDGVRPLIDKQIIQNSIDTLNEYDAVSVVIPTTDTIVVIDDDNIIQRMPNRDSLRREQTPQAFRYEILNKAYNLATDDPGFKATDDCGVVLEYLPSVKIKCIQGSEDNIKITQPIDLHIAEKIILG